MYSADQESRETAPSVRLALWLARSGQSECVLEFHSGRHGVRIVGCAPNADVRLLDPGILPVHCYFEQQHDQIWLHPAQEGGKLRVNYQSVRGPVRLPERSILEVGEARLQVAVVESNTRAPFDSPHGAEIMALSSCVPRSHIRKASHTQRDSRPEPRGLALESALELPKIAPSPCIRIEPQGRVTDDDKARQTALRAPNGPLTLPDGPPGLAVACANAQVCVAEAEQASRQPRPAHATLRANPPLELVDLQAQQSLRRRFALSLGGGQGVLMLVTLIAALSVAALVSQIVHVWPR